MADMEEILHSNASSDALQKFAFDFSCQGGLEIILPGAYYDQMKVDQIQKIDYYIRENGDQITKSKLEQIIGKINAKMIFSDFGLFQPKIVIFCYLQFEQETELKQTVRWKLPQYIVIYIFKFISLQMNSKIHSI
ncbi:Hypothetical_protein [Hexamita inflata]|uniref:Hypothetical_protein n=1 Tax=Hexamita inflata TaxID=28002 RepID=A0AA86S474_9EUKA|nr:Hypothetical protein HINF_LOCUS65395 [Hexamita inflata]